MFLERFHTRSFRRSLGVAICIMAASACGYCADKAAGVFTVVLDPGHGGKDVGAVGINAYEKNINLEVALKVGEILREKYKKNEVEVVFTRNRDVFIPLQTRCDMANRAKGNLFISIHVNSVDAKNPNRATVSGASVYTLGLGKAGENLEVAKRENSVMMLEADYTTRYNGFDPNSSESYIVFEMMQNRHLNESIKFASMAQKELVVTAGRADKGVKQDLFWVLVHTGMPAVLVELDFICNPESEQFLTSKQGTDRLAEAIANAFISYYENNRHNIATTSFSK